MGQPNETPDVTVAVTTDDTSEAIPVVEPNETVVVTPPGLDHTEILVGMSAVIGTMAERMQRIEDAVSSAHAKADEAQISATTAQIDAADAQVTALDAVSAAEEAEAAAQPAPVEEPPSKTHWLDRSWSEWKSSRNRS